MTELVNNKRSLSQVTLFLYQTPLGRLLLKGLISVPVSNYAGIFLNSPYSKWLIKGFINNNKINMKEFIKKDYTSFNDFFTREINLKFRTIDRSPFHLISPCDGRLSIYKIDKNSTLNIKSSTYTLDELVQNESIAEEYNNGYCLVFRLEASDYHRYHFIDDGNQEENIVINGVLHSVQPIAIHKYPVFKQNSRSYTIMQTSHFGKVIQMEVGALLVGKIRNYYQKKRFLRGSEKGHFEFGGSTIILLFKDQCIQLNDDIILNSCNDLETVVKMGEHIGSKLFK
ncbi:phosphatidylserine decarboxylase [Carnobacterium inhibens]|uniref:phosphatidylserine decarboxylase n=1 Tax=Carnobacterium inhibens TaxID=147709 RepID=UPI000557622E|nr:phosphatidylserine decarboxylase [Carnobacterium inhibens]